MTNQSGIHPIEYKVLVKPIETEKVTAGGILLPDEHVDRLEGAVMKGEVIEASPWAFDFIESEGDTVGAAVGVIVLFAKYAGAIVDGKDGIKYRLVNDKDILAILDE